MKKPMSLDAIAPPPRRPTMPVMEQRRTGTLEQINVRVDSELATSLRVLSAKTRQSQQELVERALKLLFKEAGEV